MFHRLMACTLLSLIATLPCAAQGAGFFPLEFLPDGSLPQVVGISNDGSVLLAQGGSAAYLWRRGTGWTALPPVNAPVTDLSGNGEVVSAARYTNSSVFRWTQASGWQQLPEPDQLTPPASAVLNDDGSRMAFAVYHPFPPNGSSPRAVFWDGQVRTLGSQPFYSIQDAGRGLSYCAIRYASGLNTAYGAGPSGSAVSLPLPISGSYVATDSASHAISSNGRYVIASVVVYTPASTGPFTFFWDSTSGVSTMLSTLSSLPRAVTSGGIVLSSNGQFGSIHEPQHQPVTTDTFLALRGAAVPAYWNSALAQFISDDGATVVGTATHEYGLGQFRTELWIARFCRPVDFNHDGLFPDTADIDDFLLVFAGSPCSTTECEFIDFNNDGLFPDTLDIDSFLSVFSGGPCL